MDNDESDETVMYWLAPSKSTALSPLGSVTERPPSGVGADVVVSGEVWFGAGRVGHRPVRHRLAGQRCGIVSGTALCDPKRRPVAKACGPSATCRHNRWCRSRAARPPSTAAPSLQPAGRDDEPPRRPSWSRMMKLPVRGWGHRSRSVSASLTARLSRATADPRAAPGAVGPVRQWCHVAPGRRG